MTRIRGIEVLEQKKAFDVIDSDGNGKITFQEVKDSAIACVFSSLMQHTGRGQDMNAMLEQPLSDQDANFWQTATDNAIALCFKGAYGAVYFS